MCRDREEPAPTADCLSSLTGAAEDKGLVGYVGGRLQLGCFQRCFQNACSCA